MATWIKLSNLEQRILERIMFDPDGFEPVEDLLQAMGADRNQFVDALETLEGEGCLSVASVGGVVVIATDDPIARICREFGGMPSSIYSGHVGQC